MMDLSAYFRREADRTAPYAGQFAPAFQAALRAHHEGLKPDDCDFYHTIEIADGRVYPGAWDLRGHEARYLGGVDLADSRIVEFGPASGWLSHYMARRARRLVVFDLPFGAGPEIVPHPDADLSQVEESGIRSATRLRNSWWFTRQQLGFDASAVYADIYEPPWDLGRFDIAVFGAILLHLSNPFRALQAAAARVDRTIVVTDVASTASHAGPATAMTFNPTQPPAGHVHWWGIGPEVVVHMLTLLGFGNCRITMHQPLRMAERPAMFTVVGQR